MKAEDPNATAPIRVKVEMSTRERTAYDGPAFIPFAVKNPWFTGNADIPTFSKEEILATKLRALLQRDKKRDVFDLAYAVVLFKDLDAPKVVTCFGKYLEAAGQAISRAEAEQRMFQKFEDPGGVSTTPGALARDRVILSRSVVT